ncbi:MAG: hypothetical protein ACLP3C_10950 [Mycobacterium sp.]|uniref:hypothetical protein n=1 Tax=Mycobacterium sp. TaxID=1785 RepID=UPI003F9AA01C
MADDLAYRIALLSVRPEYVDALLNGTKTVEFRKRPLASDVTHVAIYATHPVARVVAVFSVREQIIDSPRALWRKFGKVAGISKSGFLAYYEGYAQGVGIEVHELVRLDERVTLQEAFGIDRPPQSLRYFAPHQAAPELVDVLG